MLITVIFWSLNGLCTLQLYCFCIYISFEQLTVYSMLYCLTVEYANLRENDLIFVALKVLNQTLFEAKQYSHFNALFFF